MPTLLTLSELGSNGFYHSNELYDLKPWLQVEFPDKVLIHGVTVTNRIDCCGGRFKNVNVHVGLFPGMVGTVNANPKCGTIEGPLSVGDVFVLSCSPDPMEGLFLTLQITDNDNPILHVNELEYDFTIA